MFNFFNIKYQFFINNKIMTIINSMLFGAHIETDNLIKSAKLIKESGGNLLQIFLSIHNSAKTDYNLLIGTESSTDNTHETKHKSLEEYKEFKNFLIENNMKVVVHSSYLHNLAKDWDQYSWWIKNIELEIKLAHYIGAIGLIIHFGKKLNLSLAEAYNNMFTSLVYIHNQTKEYSDVKIILETSTGQGSEIAYKLEDLSHFYKKINRNKELKKRFGLCIDTCHLFSAGYNLKTIDDCKLFLDTFDELIGMKYIKLIHLNDSKVELGSQVDRHANIGKGYIGYKGLKYLFDYFSNLNIPIILETPNNGYQNEFKLLNSF